MSNQQTIEKLKMQLKLSRYILPTKITIANRNILDILRPH